MADLFHRVSIRKYQEKKVEPEKLDYILRASMAAPSACNQQPWEFYIVEDPEGYDRERRRKIQLEDHRLCGTAGLQLPVRGQQRYDV